MDRHSRGTSGDADDHSDREIEDVLAFRKATRTTCSATLRPAARSRPRHLFSPSSTVPTFSRTPLGWSTNGSRTRSSSRSRASATRAWRTRGSRRSERVTFLKSNATRQSDGIRPLLPHRELCGLTRGAAEALRPGVGLGQRFERVATVPALEGLEIGHSSLVIRVPRQKRFQRCRYRSPARNRSLSEASAPAGRSFALHLARKSGATTEIVCIVYRITR